MMMMCFRAQGDGSEPREKGNQEEVLRKRNQGSRLTSGRERKREALGVSKTSLNVMNLKYICIYCLIMLNI
ncbi:hypothetical protein Sjap_003274 [Stephania japonica]|uniref:Uncharacterized protein n=1 Tax=Stephania japonica TaxID=461633 RepID=A0AAP0KQ67_9MAGN